MKAIFVAVLLLAGFAARAEDTIVLGELTGEGDYTLRSQVPGGPNVNQSAHCKVAVNLKRAGVNLDFDFSYFECGGEVWNDAPFSVEVSGNDLILLDQNGKKTRKVGSVLGDGTYRLSFESHVSKKVTDQVPGPSCGMGDGHYVTKTLDLATGMTYSFKNTGGDAWTIVRHEHVETAEQTTRQVYGCNYWSWQVRATNRDVSAAVSK